MTLNPVCEHVETAQGVPLTVRKDSNKNINKPPLFLPLFLLASSKSLFFTSSSSTCCFSSFLLLPQSPPQKNIQIELWMWLLLLLLLLLSRRETDDGCCFFFFSFRLRPCVRVLRSFGCACFVVATLTLFLFFSLFLSVSLGDWSGPVQDYDG